MAKNDNSLVKSQHPLARFNLKAQRELVVRGLTALSDVREADFYFFKGEEHKIRGEYDMAISYYEKALQIDHNHESSLFNRGWCYMRKVDYDRAISDYSKAIEINPRNADAYYNRGIAYSERCDYDRAISDYSKAIEINPRDAEAYYSRGIAYYCKEDYAKACEDVRKAQDIGYEVDPKFLTAPPEASSEARVAKKKRILAINDNPRHIEDWRQLFEEGSRADNCAVANENAVIVSASSDSAREVGFEIDSASQGQEGLQKIRHAFQEGCPYAVALVDVRMPPGWDGVKTIERIWAEHPDLPVVIHAPYSDYTASEIIERLGRSEKLLIFRNPPDNEAIHRFAVALTKEWECNEATKFERVLKRAAELPWARILDLDWTRKLAENGDVRCMSELGNAYLGYRGVQEDRSEAVHWLQEAARLGDEYARKTLVEMGENW